MAVTAAVVWCSAQLRGNGSWPGIAMARSWHSFLFCCRGARRGASSPGLLLGGNSLMKLWRQDRW